MIILSLSPDGSGFSIAASLRVNNTTFSGSEPVLSLWLLLPVLTGEQPLACWLLSLAKAVTADSSR